MWSFLGYSKYLEQCLAHSCLLSEWCPGCQGDSSYGDSVMAMRLDVLEGIDRVSKLNLRLEKEISK